MKNSEKNNRHHDHPKIGFYKIQLVKNGPWVAAKIWFNKPEVDEAGDLLDDEGLMCLINGERCDPYDKWTWMGDPITETEYLFMIDDADHAKEYRPDDVKASPFKAVNLDDMKPVF